jgi:hypothetical protein
MQITQIPQNTQELFGSGEFLELYRSWQTEVQQNNEYKRRLRQSTNDFYSSGDMSELAAETEADYLYEGLVNQTSDNYSYQTYTPTRKQAVNLGVIKATESQITSTEVEIVKHAVFDIGVSDLAIFSLIHNIFDLRRSEYELSEAISLVGNTEFCLENFNEIAIGNAGTRITKVNHFRNVQTGILSGEPLIVRFGERFKAIGIPVLKDSVWVGLLGNDNPVLKPTFLDGDASLTLDSHYYSDQPTISEMQSLNTMSGWLSSANSIYLGEYSEGDLLHDAETSIRNQVYYGNCHSDLIQLMSAARTA